MAITLLAKYLDELKKGINAPDVILEFALDSGTKKFGKWRAYSDVIPCIKSVSTLQNKLDTKKGYATRGELTVVLVGRENFKDIIKDEYLKNRRVTRKDGFIAPGFLYTDYASTFAGIITDWSRKGDELTIIIADDLVDATTKIPAENEANTQYIVYENTNPVQVMTNILLTQLGIDGAYIDLTNFVIERDIWLTGMKVSRVLTDPKAANEYLNELQQETNSYIFHDGEKISFKVFAPPVPGQTIEEYSDATTILHNSLSQKSGYKDNFYNRVVVYYDYNEGGGDDPNNFDSAVIAVDSDSQGSSQWNETSTKYIYSKWLRGQYIANPWNDQTITGVVIYHVSKSNGAGQGQLTYSYTNGTLAWAAPGGTTGTAVDISEDGKYDIYDADKTKYIRVIVTTASLPTSNKTDYPNITALSGSIYASALASRLLNFYRNPSSSVTFDIDINNAAYNSQFIKVTDLKDITTDEAFEKGENTWHKERCMITSVRPDISKGRVTVEAIETKQYRPYGFISPAGTPAWEDASATQREYAFIGRNYIW